MGIFIGMDKLKKCYMGTTEAKKVYLGTQMIWQSAIPVQKPTELAPVHAYNGQEQTNGYSCPSGVTMVGTAAATNGGTYTAVYTPDAGYVWSDTGDRAPVTVTMTIQYVWIKWNVLTSYVDSVTASGSMPAGQSEDIAVITGTYGHVQNGYAFDTETGLYSLSNPAARQLANHFTYMGEGMTVISFDDIPSGGVTARKIYRGLGVSGYFHARKDPNWLPNGYIKAFGGSTEAYPWEIRESIANYSKGSSNLGNVTSTNINDYPQNAKQGDYWYTKTW